MSEIRAQSEHLLNAHQSGSNLHQFASISAMHPPTSKFAIGENAMDAGLRTMTKAVS
jgi:hypothetical protein